MVRGALRAELQRRRSEPGLWFQLDEEESRLEQEEEEEEGGAGFMAHVPVPSQKEVRTRRFLSS